jgi:HlyD family secretion protein
MASRGWQKRAGWGAIAAVLGLGALGYWQSNRSKAAQYITIPVDRGAIVHSVTATGTVNPVTVVQVGTYVSGPITSIYADFNTPVKAGQLLAKIDPRPFAAQVALARAALANAKAQLKKDQANLAYQELTYRRDQALLKNAVISHDQVDNQRSVYNQALAQLALDHASIQQQQATLNSAELNLNYTNIVSPVDGTVVSRNVDQGQTVAASYQTPTLFLVAQDLTKMQVDTNVSESDIGDVRMGQPVDFTVDAYTTKIFGGNVSQVRKAPITVQNVVTYDVVISVPNPELLLMPGMTANITIVTDRRDDVLRVAERALTFSPHQRAASANNAGQGWRGSRVWIDDAGKLRAVRITRGLDDGNYVEVVNGDIKPGELVVVDSTKTDPAQSSRPLSGPMHFPHM